jgi:COMPASS component SWD2
MATKEWQPSRLAIGAIVRGANSNKNGTKIQSMDFHKDGTYLVALSQGGNVHLIDTRAGIERKKLQTLSHGGGEIKFTHSESCVLMTSNKRPTELRYLCLYDNQYLRYFTGHTGKVTSISTSKVDDSVLSAGDDGQVLLWDLRAPKPQGCLNLPKNSSDINVFHGEDCVVFGIACKDRDTGRHHVKLYDANNYSSGPFQDIVPDANAWKTAFETFSTQASAKASFMGTVGSNIGLHHATAAMNASWTDFQFSGDATQILVSTNDDYTLVLDSYSYEEPPIIIHTPRSLESSAGGHGMSMSSDSSSSFGACFSADTNYVLVGNEDNGVSVYNRENGREVHQLNGHIGPVGVIKANPKYDCVATACSSIALWISIP